MLSWIPFVDYTSLVLGALATISGVIGLRRANADPAVRKSLPIIGMVCGIAGFAIAAIVLLLIYAVINTLNVGGA